MGFTTLLTGGAVVSLEDDVASTVGAATFLKAPTSPPTPQAGKRITHVPHPMPRSNSQAKTKKGMPLPLRNISKTKSNGQRSDYYYWGTIFMASAMM